MEAVTASPPAPELDSPELYSNRELSWLQFNERVLELAEDESLPLLERVKFLAIYASNLDEFYMVRVAGLHDQVDAGIDARGPDGLSPSETIVRIAERTRELGDRHSRQWEDVVRPRLAEDASACSTAPIARARSWRRSTASSRSRSSRC
jgi:polyphosphate kinase